MPHRPQVVVFDVNETLSDMSAMAQRFTDVGADPSLARVWFAGLLRDGFALTAAGTTEQFATLGREGLRLLLSGVDLDRDTDEAVEHVLTGFGELDVHPDVVDGIRALRAHGLRLVTLSNGATSVADTLFARAGIRDEFEQLLSVEDAGVWKPASRAYEHAAERCGVAGEDLLLVAVHPWDIDGAARAGLQTAWVDRTGAGYPAYFRPADHVVSGIDDLAGRLG
jgi:2-haloacid dehalogenase